MLKINATIAGDEPQVQIMADEPDNSPGSRHHVFLFRQTRYENGATHPTIAEIYFDAQMLLDLKTFLGTLPALK